jgi:hypothetical protein
MLSAREPRQPRHAQVSNPGVGAERERWDVVVVATMRAHNALAEWNVGILLRYVGGERAIVAVADQ